MNAATKPHLVSAAETSGDEEGAATRLYVVIDKDSKEPVALIDAANPAQATAHLVRKKFEVHCASQRETIDATKAGIEVETATARSKPE